MRWNGVLTRVACVAAITLLAACIGFKPVEQESTVDGLQRLTGAKADMVYVAPGTSLAGYKRVMLDPVEVAFKRGSATGAAAVSVLARERLRLETALLFREVFTRELEEKGGYGISDVPAPDVLRVRPSLVDLGITGPRGDSYWIQASDMTLLVELRDSETGAILVRAADKDRAGEAGDLQVDDKVSNSEDARAAFGLWAGLLRNALDAARAPATPR